MASGAHSDLTWYTPSALDADKKRQWLKDFTFSAVVCIVAFVILVLVWLLKRWRQHQQGQHGGIAPAAPAAPAPGLTNEEIEMFAISIYAPALPEGTASGPENDPMCAICLDLYEPGQQIRTLTCTHSYHVQCISEWFSSHRTCPDCRQGYPA